MTAPGAPGTLPASQGLAYGLLGLPLAFVALPLYVILPNHYATAFGMPLAALGLVLLGARLCGRLPEAWLRSLIAAVLAFSALRLLR